MPDSHQLLDTPILTANREGSYGWLQEQLAEMAAGPGLNTLPPQEVSLIRESINQAYRECFWERNGQFPAWASRLMGVALKCPTQGTATFAQGSKVFVLPDKALGLCKADAGAIVKVGTNHYTFDGINPAGAPLLVEPWDQSSGTYDVVVYFRAAQLDEEVTRLKNYPEVVGGFMLSPFSDRGDEALMRNLFVRDFYTQDPGPIYFNTNNWFAEFYLAGEPRAFWIETQLEQDGSVRHRMCVWPLPDGTRPRTVRLQCNVLPGFLKNPTDMPSLPLGTSRDILLPIARAIYASRTRRFAGDVKLALMEGDSARERLESIFPQQKKPIRFRVVDDDY